MDSVNLANSVAIRHSENQRDDGNPEFEGVITSASLTSYFNHFSEKALKRMTRDANKGVPVLAEHGHGGQPIGRSTSAVYDESSREVVSKFYIQRGLNLRPGFDGGGYADTDSYADAMAAGTASNLSIGAQVKEETCDRCDKPVRRFSFFGMVFAQCEEGHHPGQVIYVDGEDKEHREPGKGRKKVQITSTIQDANLMEFSSVAFGANPDAKVLKKLEHALQSGELEEWQLDQLNTNYSIHCHNGVFNYIVPNTHKGGSNVSDKIVDGMISQELYDELKTQNVNISNERDALSKEVEELKAAEIVHTDTANALTKANARVTELENQLATLESNKSKVIAYDAECARERGEAIRQYVRSKGVHCPKELEDEKREMLDNCDDLNQIREWGNLWRQTARQNEGGLINARSNGQSYSTPSNHPLTRPNYNMSDYC